MHLPPFTTPPLHSESFPLSCRRGINVCGHSFLSTPQLIVVTTPLLLQGSKAEKRGRSKMDGDGNDEEGETKAKYFGSVSKSYAETGVYSRG